MDDKELLELAAKAVGIKVLQQSIGYWMIEVHERGLKGWNPLIDDGDALRLAVKLGLVVDIEINMEFEPHTHVVGFSGDQGLTTFDAIEHHEEHGNDAYAATRRAIVRAAAEMARSKKQG